MKVLFPVMGAENIAVAYLAPFLKQRGHEVAVAFDRALFDDKQYFSFPLLARLCSDKRKMLRAIREAKPEILAFSVFADNYQWCLEVAREIRRSHPCVTVFGGIHATSCPEALLERGEVDYLVVGEGELPFGELLEALGTGRSPDRIPNVCFKKKTGEVIRNPPRPLLEPEDFPAVDKTIYEQLVPLKDYYLTVTSKGCIARCSYCSQNFLQRWEDHHRLGRFLREKPVAKVIDEFREMKKRYGIRYIDIKNNVLTGNRRWLEEFVRAYGEEIRLPFRIMGHPLLFQHDEADLLKRAGCHHIQIGIESFNPEVRRQVLLRYETNSQIVTALDHIEKSGISFSADLMVGLPGETEADLITALQRLVKYRRLVRASIFWLQYLPAVEITAKAYDQGLIRGEQVRQLTEGLQDHYLATGSPMEPQRKRILKSYHLLFRLLPILSPSVLDGLLALRIHKLFRYLPFQVVMIVVVDVLVSLVKKDYYARWIMTWYGKHLLDKIRGKAVYLSRPRS